MKNGLTLSAAHLGPELHRSYNAKGRGGDGKGVDIFHTCFLHMCPDFQLYLSKLKSIKYEKRCV